MATIDRFSHDPGQTFFLFGTWGPLYFLFDIYLIAAKI